VTESNRGDATYEENEKLRDLEERLARLEREQAQHLPSLTEIVDRFVPADVRDHLRAARREQLLAARALLDDMLERLADGNPREGKRRRIEVE